jgi:hypothetical protein
MVDVSAFNTLKSPTGEDGVPVLEAKSRHCRWPLGTYSGKTELYCGDETARIGASYCANHTAMAYRPPERRSKS